MRALPHTHSCFVCGESNPAGLHLRMHTNGRLVTARWRPEPHHVGFQSTVHGGLISTVLDELMVWACAVQTRRFAYCGELTVRFRRPLRPGEEVELQAKLARNLRGRVFEAQAEILDPSGQSLATAEGKYLPVPEELLVEMLPDVVGDLAEFLDLPDQR